MNTNGLFYFDSSSLVVQAFEIKYINENNILKNESLWSFHKEKSLEDNYFQEQRKDFRYET